MKTTASTKRRAIVIGGSLGGLFTANMLLRSGWDVEVFERSAEALEGRGAGFVTHQPLFDGLARAGVPAKEVIGVSVSDRIVLDRSGTEVGRLRLPQVFTSWSRLFSLLKRAFPAENYHLAKNLNRITEESGRVIAHFEDGQCASADLLVGADGIRSSVRGLLLPDVKPKYAGYVAWRGLVDEKSVSPHTLSSMFDCFAFCLPPGEQMLGYPVSGPHDEVARGQRSYNFVWYRPADELTELPGLLTDSTGRVHASAIPPHLLRAEVVAAMRADAESILAPQFADIVRKTVQPLVQPIFDLESPRMSFGRIAILGDASFVARPHCGMGVTKAADDAALLVDSLQEHADLGEALAQYEARRLRFGSAVVEHARNLGAYMQAQIRSDSERAMAERYRTPEAIMAETAITMTFE